MKTNRKKIKDRNKKLRDKHDKDRERQAHIRKLKITEGNNR